jgi:hypothetical protein
MKLAKAYEGCGIEEIKTALAGATIHVYSCAQPAAPEASLFRNRFLAEFVLASPAFDGESIKTVENPVLGRDTGVPLFVRASKPDGTVIADFSAGPGDMDVKFATTSCTVGSQVEITRFQIRSSSNQAPRFVSPRDKLLGR